MMNIEYADRITQLPPYLFAEIDRLKKEVIAQGADVVNLGVGDPDLPTPAPIVELMKDAVTNSLYHQYPSYRGEGFYRKDVARYMQERFGVEFNPEEEIIATIGSKEGIANFPWSIINPGDYALVPEPCYPVLPTLVKFMGGKIYDLPLTEKNHFFPSFDNIPKEILAKAKILYLNYPNNPTGAFATRSFLEEAVDFACLNDIVIVYDNAYSEVLFDGLKPLSIFQIPNARHVAIEFHSLSKLFNMTGWRIGFACGNPFLISGFAQVKTNIDSGAFSAIQEVAGKAITEYRHLLDDNQKIYTTRRTIIREALDSIGLEYFRSSSTFYVWVKTPAGFTSSEFTAELLQKLHIVTTPGTGFGPSGEGWVRLSLTASTDKIIEAARRLKERFHISL